MLRDYYDEDSLRGIIVRHRETWYAVSTIKGDKRYQEYIESVDEQTLTGGIDMCETLDYIEKRGIEKGIEKGTKALLLIKKEPERLSFCRGKV